MNDKPQSEFGALLDLLTKQGIQHSVCGGSQHGWGVEIGGCDFQYDKEGKFTHLSCVTDSCEGYDVMRIKEGKQSGRVIK